jgi:two-component system cell cycle response regulator
VDQRHKPRLLFARGPGQLKDQLDPSCLHQFEITEAASLTAAQHAARRGPFSLILVDEGLLHGKALLLCQTLKQSQGAPILIQVHEPDPLFLKAALEAGAQDFVVGPARFAELRARAKLAVSARTVSERVMGLVRRLTDLSRRDPLTKLFNRGVSEEWLIEAVQSQRPFHLLMLDLDHFKSINDTHGHATGDAVLMRIAILLQKQLRHSDLVIRYGGEEFLIVLDGGSAKAAQAVAQKIRRAVEAEKIQTPTGLIRITASIGLLSVPEIGATVTRPKVWMKRLLVAADKALYQAKAAGRNRVVRGKSPSTKQANRPARSPSRKRS